MKFTKPIIFPATAKFAPVLVLAFVACSVTFAQDVRTNYMPGTDFSKYHIYAWVDEVQGVPSIGGHLDQILDTQVKQAIDLQMAAKGLTKVTDGGKPDLLLGYQIMIDREKKINVFGNSSGGWGPWGGSRFDSFSANTSTINIGTFVIGMYDPAAKKLVGSVGLNMQLNPVRNQRKTRKGSTRERRNC